jgi:hypothetical protein
MEEIQSKKVLYSLYYQDENRKNVFLRLNVRRKPSGTGKVVRKDDFSNVNTSSS